MIRAAKKEDCKEVVPLIHSAIGSIANTLAGTQDDAEALEVVGDFFCQEGNRLSYENTLVCEMDGKVVGFLLAYHGSRTEELDRPLVQRIADKTGDPQVQLVKEARDDEYYLDSVAVADTHQGHGIGRQLLQAFEQKALSEDYHKLALIVEENNDKAHQLYSKMGYSADGFIDVSGHHFQRMIKYC